jgi:hypothetical protein
MSSGSEVERPIDEPVLQSDVTVPHPPNLALPNLVHGFVTLNRPPYTTELPKMLLGPDPLLDGAVILLQDVVQILKPVDGGSAVVRLLLPSIQESQVDNTWPYRC